MAYANEGEIEINRVGGAPATEALKALDIELNKLGSMVDEFVARLNPILSPEGPTAADDRGTDLTAVRMHSEHVECIDRYTSTVADVHRRLRLAVDRLDI